MGLAFGVDGTDALIQVLSEVRAAGGSVVTVVSQRRNLEEALFTERKAS